MTVQRAFIRHLFAGGWAPDFGPNVDAAIGDAEIFQIPFLSIAENIVYMLNGGVRKIPGADKLNAVTLESGATIKGIFDFWISGGSGTPLQKRVIHIGTKIYKDDADANFTQIISGLTAGAVPVYAVLEDLLVMVNGTNATQSYDGSIAGAAAGSPPIMQWVATHKNRMWGGGNPGNPSRLYYTAQLAPNDWIGAGSGSIDIDSDDGDGLVGGVSHKDELIVFKGPNVGSIHRITGSSPADFARRTYISGVPCAGHNSIFPYRDDIGFISADGLVRSLNATAAFGDYKEAILSLPINSWIFDNVNFARLRHAWAKPLPSMGLVLIALPINGSLDPNTIIAMDYRLPTQSTFGDQQTTVRWAHWPCFDTQAVCLGQVIDPNDSNRRIVMAGGDDGFIRRLGRAERSIDGSEAITFKVRTPALTYATPILEKTITAGSIGLRPRGSGDMTFIWVRDNQNQQNILISQLGAADVLGPAPVNPFILDTSELGGESFLDAFFELDEGGTFRSISYEVNHSVLGEDIEIHAIGAAIERGSWTTVNVP